MNNQQVHVSKDAVFEAVVSQANNYYKARLAISSSFLGGSIMFLEKISPISAPISLLFLFASWGLLVFCIATTIQTYSDNVKSGNFALAENFNGSEKTDKKNKLTDKMSRWSLIIGISLLVIFGIINMACKYL